MSVSMKPCAIYGVNHEYGKHRKLIDDLYHDVNQYVFDDGMSGQLSYTFSTTLRKS